MNNQREASQRNWDSNDTKEAINAGSFQRIADAIEAMARSHTALIEEKERYRRSNINLCARVNRLKRSQAALRGEITKLRKRLMARAERS